ncbi:hypothetical protein [Miltoncostaea oceani]|uniref:hypothetical protein n=1 Tax=Miltoncostaea oceani TaxID=2843216 RepID=UPI001C3E5A4E|nr:hypothetical protein [Miltoncostaea oceani]
MIALAPAIATGAPTAEVEPNDNAFQAVGPVGPEGLTGAIQVSEDVDLFLLQLRPQRQVRINYEVTNPGPSCTTGGFRSVRFRLSERIEGNLISTGETYPGVTSDSETITTPGVFGGPSQLYQLRVNGGDNETPGCAYRVTITDPTGGPTDALDPTPLPAFPGVATPEPNDIPAQAFGPLAAATVYEGGFETSNDTDILYFKLAPGTKASFELSSIVGTTNVSVRDDSDQRINNNNFVNADVTGIVDFEVPASGTALVHLAASSGTLPAVTRWRLRILSAQFTGPTQRVVAKKPIKAKALRVRTRARLLTTRVRLPTAGRLQLRLVGKGRSIGIGRVSASGPRTVSITYRRPARVATGRYILEMRFTAKGRPLGISRARVIFR